MKPLAWALLTLAAMPFSADTALGQTFEATRAIHEVKCQRYLFSNKCITVETDRLHWTFTKAKLGFYVFGRTWATASHCTHVDASETKCLRSIFISTDPEWNRLLWGQAGTFLRQLGTAGTAADGPYRFWGPLGVDITRREGEWHVGFIADSKNNRVVVIAFGYTCMCVRWLGTLDGSESGTPLREPYDVAWDPAGTWTFADDRVFIADTYNDRIVVYQVGLDLNAWTMTKTYLNSFGTSGSGAAQLAHPQGITVSSGRSIDGSSLNASVYISDTDNERVSAWYYDTPDASTPGTPTPAQRSTQIPGSKFVGITEDYYGDVIVADQARNVLVKFTRFSPRYPPPAPLKTYGGTPSWSTGNFNQPTDVAAIPYYWQSGASLIREKLPYVQSVEQWTATTGGQLHHLGVDAEQLSVSPGQCDASFSFLFTGYGDYVLKVKNSAGAIVATFWTRRGVASGWQHEYWDATGNPTGLYSYYVEHESAYGDETQWRRTDGPYFNLNCFTVTAGVPDYISSAGTYDLTGSSNQPADSWTWQRDGSPWASGQYSSVYIPDDPGAMYTITWGLTARRTSDGQWDSDARSTYVAIPAPPPPPPPPPCPPTCEEQPLVGPVRDNAAMPRVGPTRRNYHIGSGAWIGARVAGAPTVTQFFSLAGQPTMRGKPWPNALGGDTATVQVAVPTQQRSLGRAVFSRRSLGEGADAYRARFELTADRVAGAFVGLALDPELGRRPGDELLGWDADANLAWVEDPDSGVLGYRLIDVPRGASVTVRQFSTRADAWRPAPAGDSAAYAEITARDPALTGKRGDVRFVIAVGPVADNPRAIDIGFVVLTAPSVAVLRERALRVPQSVLPLFGDDAVTASAAGGIARFQFTQAPPEPEGPVGVHAISPALVPAFTSQPDSMSPAPGNRAALRDAVRRYGITALAFAVPDQTSARVTIRIYDPAGRLVRILVNDVYPSGAYRAQWDLEDQRGARVAPGVYIAVMEAKGFRATSKLVVVP